MIIKQQLPHLGDAIMALRMMEIIYGQTGEPVIWAGTPGTNALFLHHPAVVTTPVEHITYFDVDLSDMYYAGWNDYAEAFGVDWDGKPPKLIVTSEKVEQHKLLDSGRMKIGVCTNSRDKHRSYPHHKALVKKFKKHYEVYVFGREQLPIRQLVAEVSQMDKLVTVDAGVAHLGGCLGVPLIVIEGSTDCKQLYSLYANVQYVSTNKDKCDRKPCVDKGCKYIGCKYVNCMYLIRPREICEALTSNKAKREMECSTRVRRDDKPSRHALGTIALMRLDGLGGTLTLSDQAKKIKESTGAEITLIIRHNPELFDDNPYVDHVITVGRINWDDCLQVYKPVGSGRKDKFTALADIRMAVGKWYDPTNIFHQDFTNWESYYEQFPLKQQELSIYGLHHIQLTDKILGLSFDTIDSKIYFDLSLPEWFSEKDYICVCPGVDTIHEGKQQTKCWYYWDELVKKIDMPVVQLGTEHDERIDGTMDLRGKTTIKDCASILSRASVVVTIEGGLMHLAHAVGQQKVIVLFGPTAGPLFLYPPHIHIDSFPCKGCFSTIENWAFECKERIDAVCMRSITSERVVYACNRLLGKQSNETVVANTGL